jgi:hypothetical protein
VGLQIDRVAGQRGDDVGEPGQRSVTAHRGGEGVRRRYAVEVDRDHATADGTQRRRHGLERREVAVVHGHEHDRAPRRGGEFGHGRRIGRRPPALDEQRPHERAASGVLGDRHRERVGIGPVHRRRIRGASSLVSRSCVR